MSYLILVPTCNWAIHFRSSFQESPHSLPKIIKIFFIADIASVRFKSDKKNERLPVICIMIPAGTPIGMFYLFSWSKLQQVVDVFQILFQEIGLYWTMNIKGNLTTINYKHYLCTSVDLFVL